MFRRAKDKLDKKFELKLEDVPKLERSKTSSSARQSAGKILEQKPRPKDDPKDTELADLMRRVRIEHPDKFVPKPKLERSKTSSSTTQSEGKFPEQKLHPKDDPKVAELADLIRRVRIEHPEKFVQRPKLMRSKTQIIFTPKDYRNRKGVLPEYVRRLPRIREEAPPKKDLPKTGSGVYHKLPKEN